MFLNTFKALIIICLLSASVLAQSITFYPPDGWEKNSALSETGEKLVFTPANNTNDETEVLTITTKKDSLSADKLLWNNLIEIKKEYPDFKYYKPEFKPENSMGLGCTSAGSFCIVQRIESYQSDFYIYTYINKRPHYSQGLFGKWTNILGQIKAGKQEPRNKNDEVFEL